MDEVCRFAVRILITITACLTASSSTVAKPNVLFIAVDDLRPELGCYGRPVQSPNIDRLARQGTLFERAYVQCALCMPSRASILTGRRPDTTGVVDFSVRFRDVLGDVITLPQRFKNNGYHAAAFGKIFHNDDPVSWSERLWRSKCKPYHTEFGNQVLSWIKEDHRRLTYVWDLGDGVEKIKRPGGLPWEAPEVPDDALRDGDIANAAIEKMNELKDQPFFLAVGFHKPHLPFIAPKKYFDLYDPDEIAPATNPFPPRDAPKFATYNWNDLRHYYGIPDVGPVSAQQARELKHAYYACVSFMDAQVGRVLKNLDDLGLSDNTIVILWGDHGWQLGEHGMWDKHSNFETSTHAPLIIRTPGQNPARTNALVEFVDIYPTLCELCGLSVDDGLEGQSFAPLIEAPHRAWKEAAFSQYKRVIPGYGKIAPGMGYSMRTDRFRFTEWLVPGTEFRAYELYDHQSDPDENINLAEVSEHKMIVNELKTKLHAGWRHAKAR